MFFEYYVQIHDFKGVFMSGKKDYSKLGNLYHGDSSLAN